MDIRTYYRKFSEGLRTTKGRNILTFFIFLCISTVFWFLLALNDDIQKDYTIPVTLEDFPEKVTILSGMNPMVGITVKDKGSALMKYSFGNEPKIKLRYEDFTRMNDTVLLLTQTQLNSAVRSTFGTGANIIAMRPDSLRVVFTTNPGIRVALSVNAEVRTEPQYAYSGHPECSVDSVTIYSNSPERFRVRHVETRGIVLANLTDTTRVEIPVQVPSGYRSEPASVTVSFPVEPLVSRVQKIPVEVANLPSDRRLVTFPSVVEVNYLVPRSMFNVENFLVKATVDYDAISGNKKSLPVKLSRLPSFVKGVSVNPPSVEYVVERKD